MRIDLLLIISYACLLTCKVSKPQTTQQQLTPLLTAIVVSDIQNSSQWFEEKLGFKFKEVIKDYPKHNLKVGVMEINGFYLELVENVAAVPQNELPIPDDTNLNGYSKLGFMVNDIELLYAHLKKFNDVDFLTDVGTLPPSNLPIQWPSNYLLIRDPDGNMIQFFSQNDVARGDMNMKPWLVGITVSNLDSVSLWYRKHLGFKHINTIGEAGNRRNIIALDGFVLELFEPSNVLLYNTLEEPQEYLGIRKLSFGTPNFDDFSSLIENPSIDYVFPPDSTSSAWASRSMIILDNEGNWVQIFDTNL